MVLKRRSGPPACKSKRAVTLVINYAFYGSEIERRARADWRETDAHARQHDEARAKLLTEALKLPGVYTGTERG